ncbi:hypothetical protein VTP01DRAFT_3382 [Rhizomucor pusillus]|uniref:uncharacterized protein n=1 Tax=Rhizomucor pusillus TaxID=4840 RepID=UPI003742261B
MQLIPHFTVKRLRQNKTAPLPNHKQHDVLLVDRKLKRLLSFHRSSVDSCLSTSSSIASSISSKKSLELEALIVDYPTRTLRVSLTPACAA